MCYRSHRVYTVCAHRGRGYIYDCKAQKDRRERWRFVDKRLYTVLPGWSCRLLTEITEIVYGFCDECRDWYRGFETRDTVAILNYWAFKNRCGHTFSVPAKYISADEVFGRPPPSLEDLKRPRCELVALGRELPLSGRETPVSWLQRLEGIRQFTLEWAEQSTAAQLARQVGAADSAWDVRPPKSPPMSADPFVPSANTSQVHFETLRRLCGEIPREFRVVTFQHGTTAGTPKARKNWRKSPWPIDDGSGFEVESLRGAVSDYSRSKSSGGTISDGPASIGQTRVTIFDYGDFEESRAQEWALAIPREDTSGLGSSPYADGTIDICLAQSRQASSPATTSPRPHPSTPFPYSPSMVNSMENLLYEEGLDEEGDEFFTVDLDDDPWPAMQPSEQFDIWIRPAEVGQPSTPDRARSSLDNYYPTADSIPEPSQEVQPFYNSRVKAGGSSEGEEPASLTSRFSISDTDTISEMGCADDDEEEEKPSLTSPSEGEAENPTLPGRVPPSGFSEQPPTLASRFSISSSSPSSDRETDTDMDNSPASSSLPPPAEAIRNETPNPIPRPSSPPGPSTIDAAAAVNNSDNNDNGNNANCADPAAAANDRQTPSPSPKPMSSSSANVFGATPAAAGDGSETADGEARDGDRLHGDARLCRVRVSLIELAKKVSLVRRSF